jgi:hypothetical protein
MIEMILMAILWIVGGMITLCVGFLIIAFVAEVISLTIGWSRVLYLPLLFLGFWLLATLTRMV